MQWDKQFKPIYMGENKQLHFTKIQETHKLSQTFFFGRYLPKKKSNGKKKEICLILRCPKREKTTI